MLRRTLIATLAATALLAPATAGADPQPPPFPTVITLEVRSVDEAEGTVTGVQHCLPGHLAGRGETFDVEVRDFSEATFPVGAMVGIKVDWTRTPPAITQVGPPTCSVHPTPVGPPPPGANQPEWPALPHTPGPVFGPVPGPVPGGPGPAPIPGGPGNLPPQGEPGGPPILSNAMTSRVWKFVGEADGFDDGVLSMTLAKILNLPKSMSAMDDRLVDQDTAVIVDKATRVYDGKKEVKQRAERSLLDDAEDVRVQGKLLRPHKWREDADGEPVTTIRAKKIYVLD